MRKNHSKIVCIKLVHLPYLYICASLRRKLFTKFTANSDKIVSENTYTREIYMYLVSWAWSFNDL